MTTNDRDDSDTTLPSLEAAIQGMQNPPELTLTLVFHPDLSRVGESAVLPRGKRIYCVGRRTPAFGRPAGTGSTPLNDPHVSRQALELEMSGDRVCLRRTGDACRSRVDGVELDSEITLDKAQLIQGVPLLLSHSVVLLLSLSPLTIGGAPSLGEELVGSSSYMRDLRGQIEQAAGSDLDVLIRGETGTGKELVARAIHRGSRRARAPLVSVNISAIPPGLSAATLFGAARGAFTGADRPRTGYFQEAAGGTLFLDEIGDAPGELQPQLLRALQQREIQVVGGPVQKVDLRVVSATDAELEGENCSFKSALRHRLGAIEIALQPLRQHRWDIGELLHHYFRQFFAEAGREYLLPVPDSEPELIAAWAALFQECVRYQWPGNIRQLHNLCGQVSVASRTRLTVPPSVLEALSGGAANPVRETEAREEDSPAASPYRRLLSVSDEEFDCAMEASCHEVAGVAERLGVSRQAVYRRIANDRRYRLASEVPVPELKEAVNQCEGDALAAAMMLRVSASGLRARLRQSS